MKSVKKSQSKNLGRIIVSKADLKRFWTVLERHATADARTIDEAKKANPNKYFPDPDPDRPEISISSAGGITTEADDGAVLDSDVLDTLKTKSVMLSYSSFRPIRKTIRVRFEEDDSLFSSGSASLSVSGNDVAWVDGIFAELERIASAIKPQSAWFQNWRRLIVFVFAVAIGFVFTKVMALLSGPPDNAPDPHWIVVARAHPPLLTMFKVAVLFLMGIFPAGWLVSWIGRLWPDLEFDFGPEHLKNSKKWRARIGAVATLILLPILLEAFQRFGLGWR